MRRVDPYHGGAGVALQQIAAQQAAQHPVGGMRVTSARPAGMPAVSRAPLLAWSSLFVTGVEVVS